MQFRRSVSSGPYTFSFGVERLREFRGLLASARAGSVRAGTYVLKGRAYGAEIRALHRCGGRVVVSAGLGPELDRLRDRYGRGTIHVYCEGRPGFQHLKYLLCEAEGNSLYRFSTGAMATIDLGIAAVGTKGIGRTELFFQTSHGGICREGRAVADALEADRVPPSGRYLRLQTPAGDDLLPALTADVRHLDSDGEILHVRASMHEDSATPNGVRSLLSEWHTVLERACSRSAVYVAADSPDGETQRTLRRLARAGATIGLPRFFPGSSRLPRWMLATPAFGRWFRRRSAQEHYNLTLIKRRDGRSIVYFGAKRDAPQVEGAVDGMLRLESEEFPGLTEGLGSFVRERFSFCRRGTI